LALALKRAQLHFPPAVLLSAELGQQTGDLGGALRRSLGHSNESEIILRSAAERVFYLVCLVCFGLAMLTFMLVKIVPAFAKIFDEFSVDLPAETIWLVGTAHFFVMSWPLIVLVGVVLLVLLVRSLSYYTGYSPRYLPGMTASWQRADRSVIMHWLAHAVRQDRPLPEMMRLISGYVTRNRLRRRLQQSAKRIDQGVEWTESLQDAGLIRKPEAAVFRSAEQTGNLAWALEEMAESNVRRTVYQLRALTNVAFPAALLVLGGFVLVVACAMLTPLFDLIGWMT
jgi:type II secretory pathway component PulF